MSTSYPLNTFDVEKARARCRQYRRRILEISQLVPALHIAPAFSSIEIVDACYNHLMRRDANGEFIDTFIMSKGHGYMSQVMALEDLGIMPTADLENYGTPKGCLGGHPDYGNPGIAASTGSLGHGLGMAVGMAAADRIKGEDRKIFVCMGDGEMQEGSVWEAIMMAGNLNLSNIVAILDFNNYQSLAAIEDSYPYFNPVHPKVAQWGWDGLAVDGHDGAAIVQAVMERKGDRPLFITCATTKGKGVSYMENVPIWHYRSPNKEEFALAMSELAEPAQ